MEIFAGELRSGDLTQNANGGSELMLRRIHKCVKPELLKRYHIVNSRVESSLDHDLKKIFIAHDLPGDPATDFLHNEGWKVFEKLIFVSNWQMQIFSNFYSIPLGRCMVMLNAIEPIEVAKGLFDEIHIGYWSTPHRGLSIVVPVFEFLATKYPEIRLDVFSSFKLYGWEQRDEPYQELFNKCKTHPQIKYHGTVDNNAIRQYAGGADIFAYPSIWAETSCLCLMEAMSAGMICVHSNLAALPETSANWTSMYQFNEDLNEHAKAFHLHLENAINKVQSNRRSHYRTKLSPKLQGQKEYTDLFYNWDIRCSQWNELLEQIIERPHTNTILLSK